MSENIIATTHPGMKKTDLIVIRGAGGFIGGSLTRYFHNQGFCRIRAVDKKPLPLWYQVTEGVENIKLDLSDKENAVRAMEGAWKYIIWQQTWMEWDSLNATEWNVCVVS